MARTQTPRRRRRDAPPPPRRPAPRPDDLMFFPKLRRRAKWVFLALAVMFALSVVFFGVGTGIPGGNPVDALQDIFQERAAQRAGPSVEEARERVEANPEDAEARLQLANALQGEGRTAEAIEALEAYVEMRPRDPGALQQLAALYNARGREAQERAMEAQAEAQRYLFPQTFLEPTSPLAGALMGAPIGETVGQRATTRVTQSITEMQESFRREAEVYQRLARIDRENPAVHLQLGQASQFAGDVQGAIEAYERFLELAPDDPNAPIVREQLRELRRQGSG